MKKKFYKDLENKYKEISLLYETMGILYWDRSTFMPKNSIGGRTDQLTNLYVLSHKMLKDKKFFNYIKKSEKIKKLNNWEKKNLKLIKKEYRLNNVLDKKLLEKISKATSNCEMQWRVSKENNNFNSIVPYLEEVIELRKIEAKIKSKVLNCSSYDALLNDYEDDLNSDKIDKIFNQLISFLPSFLKEVLDFQKKNKKIIHIKDEISQYFQEKLGRLLMKKIGFDFLYGRLDVSMHPFCGGAYKDSRITTRYNEKNFVESLMGILHETGHALYNLGLPEKWKYQPVGRALGTVVHESQSLFMEMQICRSYEFLKFVSPFINKIFNKKGKKWEGIIKNLNKKKSLILIDKQIKKQEEENLINIIYVPIKGHRNYYLIEKITELGISNIYPIISEHSVIKKFNYKRANACAVAASQQSGRLSVPEIHEFKSLKSTLSLWNKNDQIIFCDETEKKFFFNDLFESKSKKKINTILIGPEGGFSLSEKTFLKNLNYIYGLTLGKRILRADTAAISALTLLIDKK